MNHDMHPFSGVSISGVHTITDRGLKYPRRVVDLSGCTGISALFTTRLRPPDLPALNFSSSSVLRFAASYEEMGRRYSSDAR